MGMEREFESFKSVDVAVKEAIAEREECHPDDLGRLERAVDVDELKRLVESESNVNGVHQITFQYCGYTVGVTSDRVLHIE
jgi:hypothetical protein